MRYGNAKIVKKIKVQYIATNVGVTYVNIMPNTIIFMLMIIYLVHVIVEIEIPLKMKNIFVINIAKIQKSG